MISIIAAMDRRGGIGFQNTIPWLGKLPRDMKHFKERTTGHPVIMGRRTFESLGRPLPNRTNIVLSTDITFMPSGVEIARTKEDALSIAGESHGNDEIFIIGGQVAYEQLAHIADRMYLTIIDHEFTCDTHFPSHFPLYAKKRWESVSEESFALDEKNLYPMRFLVLESVIAP